MKVDTIILSRLLDKYERSKHLTNPGESNRRVMLSIEKRELPEYTYEDATVRDEFNRAAEELERRRLVTIEWVKARPVLAILSLNLNTLESSYALIQRPTPQEYASTVIALIEARLSNVTVPWISAWGKELCKKAKQSFRMPAYCKENTRFLSGLLDAFIFYDALGGESTTMRAFSAKCYQNSKRFEHEFRDEFLRIASQYCGELREICEQQELGVRDKLALLGIYARPELYEFSGKCAVITDTGEADISPFYPLGIALPSTSIERIKGFRLNQIHKIIFIENKTNYDEFLVSEMQPNELIFYHGGFLSPQKRKLLAKLSASLSLEASVLFWADIDLGGFQMFLHLQAIFPQLKPLRMGGTEVKKYRDSGLSRSEEYLSRIASCKSDAQYSIFQEAIDEILASKVTIEQEVFLR